ncbi:MAG: K(+)-transporting ATPase subunit C [Parachlamydiales bacterium]|nr:K(+)-transporting ATPase subunit C [Parachlamydiales bacterium]
MRKNLLNSFLITVVLGIILCFIYPFFIFLVSNIFFKIQKDGSFLKVQNEIVGSKLIGQEFVSDYYFHSRPSNNSYNTLNSSASNLAPTSKQLLKNVTNYSSDYRKINRLNKNLIIPVDAVTSSASGLDPHITYQNALIQAKRVAIIRKVEVDKINSLVDKHLEKSIILGRPRINVLLLNLDLDQNYPLR